MIKSIAKDLFEINAIQIGDFQLKSGEQSPFYLDLRLIPSYPDQFRNIVEHYCTLINNLIYRPAAIAGIMSAGIPFATGISLKLSLPLLQIRKESKDYGTLNLIEGKIPEKGNKIVLIDDLITSGGSKSIAVNALRDRGLIVNDLVVLIDRSAEKDREQISRLNLNIHSMGNVDDLLEGLLTYAKSVSHEKIIEIQNAILQWKKN